jgi:porphobilinogen synthase
MAFPLHRPRRLRRSEVMRKLIRETDLSVNNLVYPLFVRPGRKVRREVSSMPGVYQFSLDQILKEVNEIGNLGIPAILLFGVPDEKSGDGANAFSSKGIVQETIRAIKKESKDILVITDVCLCSYLEHGHCGLIKKGKNGSGCIDNDSTLKILQKTALSHAEAGADVVAPSGMMDGTILALREALDSGNYQDVAIMSYAAKYASSFYGPFRDAAESPPKFGDRKTYQMDYHNSKEALKEIALDVKEGADIVMVKPALAYLDVIRLAKDKFNVPVAAYHVSGEYSMVKSAAQKGWINEKDMILEILASSRRAGSDILITYWAKEAARWMK